VVLGGDAETIKDRFELDNTSIFCFTLKSAVTGLADPIERCRR